MKTQANRARKAGGAKPGWRRLVLLLCGILLLVAAGCEDGGEELKADPDVTGNWTYSNSRASPVIALVQSGVSIGGTFRDTSGQFPLSGSRERKQIQFLVSFGDSQWMNFGGDVGTDAMYLVARDTQGTWSQVTLVRSR
jgi:hypothetical protein